MKNIQDASLEGKRVLIRVDFNVPLDELVDRIEELKAMQPMVLCCESGNRSGQAVSYLSSNGFEKVYNGGGWMSVDSQKS